MEQAVLKIFHTTSSHLTWRWIVLHVQHLILKVLLVIWRVVGIFYTKFSFA